MGIISGFLQGAGRGAAQGGQMLLADKLMKERREADFLRDEGLRRELQAERHTFQTGLQASGQTYQTNAAKTLADAKVEATRTETETAATVAEQKAITDLALQEKKNAGKAPKDPFTMKITVDGQVQEVLVDRATGKYAFTTPDGSAAPVDPSTASWTQAAKEWAALEKENENVAGFGGQSGAEEASGMKKKDWLLKRAIEADLGVDPAPAATAAPTVAPQAEAAATTAGPGADQWYKDMISDGADPAKALATVQEKHPEYKPSSGQESSVVDAVIPTAAAADKPTPIIGSQMAEPKPERDAGPESVATGTEDPLIPEKTKSAEPATPSERNTGIIQGARTGRDVERATAKLAELNADLKEAEADLKKYGDSQRGRTGGGRANKVERLKKQIIGAEKLLKELGGDAEPETKPSGPLSIGFM